MGATTLTDGDPVMVGAPLVSTGLLPMLGAAPIAGRLFTKDEAVRGDTVALISERLWRTRFGAAADTVGKRMAIEGVPHTIVGVVPSWFAFPERTTEVWRPLPIDQKSGVPIGGWAVAFLRPGVTRDAATDALNAISAGLVREGIAPAGARLFFAEPVQRRFGNQSRTELSLLFGAVMLVLVIACVNVANLLLARSAVREGEFAVMSALGAGRGLAVRLVLIESLALALVSGVAGVFVAQTLLNLVVASMPKRMVLLSSSLDVLDWRALGFAVAVSSLTCLLVGLLPALRVGRANVVDAIKGRAPGVAGPAHERWHRVLVVAQLALVIPLLITAGLLLRSFGRLVSVEPGFAVDGVVVAEAQFPSERYTAPGQSYRVMRTLADRLSATPGVQAVAFAEGAPPSGGGFSFGIAPEAEGQPPRPPAGELELPRLTVSSDYFAALRIPIVAGRTFGPDDGTDAVIISSVVARRYWGEASPIGGRFRISPRQPWTTVVGVAADIKSKGLDDPMGEGMEIYEPFPTTRKAGFNAIIVRTAGDPGATLRQIRDELKGLDPLLPILEASTMAERLSDSVIRPRFLLRLCGLFAGLALLMVTVGIYGTTAYWVGRRQRELGVRLALGSTPAGVVGLVVRRGLWTAAWGTGLGLGAAMLLAGVVQALLFQTQPEDPLVLVATAGVVGLLVLVGCAGPAIRASRVDPARVLRAE
jgi:predicted permease